MSSEDTKVSLETNPMMLGERLADAGQIDVAILGAMRGRGDIEKGEVFGDLMSGLLMDGILEFQEVRFPKIHRALGRIVIGNRRYYQPKPY